jgi:hypothetical protein
MAQGYCNYLQEGGIQVFFPTETFACLIYSIGLSKIMVVNYVIGTIKCSSLTIPL